MNTAQILLEISVNDTTGHNEWDDSARRVFSRMDMHTLHSYNPTEQKDPNAVHFG